MGNRSTSSNLVFCAKKGRPNGRPFLAQKTNRSVLWVTRVRARGGKCVACGEHSPYRAPTLRPRGRYVVFCRLASFFGVSDVKMWLISHNEIYAGGINEIIILWNILWIWNMLSHIAVNIDYNVIPTKVAGQTRGENLVWDTLHSLRSVGMTGKGEY